MGTVDIQSMTGFAAAQHAIAGADLSCAIRSVNGRSLDVKLRLPAGLDAHEPSIRKAIAARLARGNLQVSIAVESAPQTESLTIDADTFRRLAARAGELAAETGIAPPTSDGILQLRGVVTADEAGARLDEVTEKEIVGLVDAALDGLIEARRREGAAMAELITGHVETIAELTDRATADPATQPAAIKERLAGQIERLLGDMAADGLDPVRLNAEAAVLAAKADVTEEIGRLRAHVAAAREHLRSGGPVGRKLDFLAQEFNREANTLCSKSASSSLTAIGLELKSVIDQLREQVQNLQ